MLANQGFFFPFCGCFSSSFSHLIYKICSAQFGRKLDPILTDGFLSILRHFIVTQTDMKYLQAPAGKVIISKSCGELHRVLGSCGFQWCGFHLCTFSKNSPNIQHMRFSLHKWRNSFTYGIVASRSTSRLVTPHVNNWNKFN